MKNSASHGVKHIIINTTNNCIYRYVNLFIINSNSIAFYMFRASIVTFFREVFFEGCVTENVKII
jgi:hypothetical protein